MSLVKDIAGNLSSFHLEGVFRDLVLMKTTNGELQTNNTAGSVFLSGEWYPFIEKSLRLRP